MTLDEAEGWVTLARADLANVQRERASGLLTDADVAAAKAELDRAEAAHAELEAAAK